MNAFKKKLLIIIVIILLFLVNTGNLLKTITISNYLTKHIIFSEFKFVNTMIVDADND